MSIPPCPAANHAVLRNEVAMRISLASHCQLFGRVAYQRAALSILLSVALLLSFGSILLAQDSPKLRKFQTTYNIDMYAEAEVKAKKIGNVRTGVILEALEEIQRYGGYIKVTYKDKTGYVFKAELQRYVVNLDLDELR